MKTLKQLYPTFADFDTNIMKIEIPNISLSKEVSEYNKDNDFYTIQGLYNNLISNYGHMYVRNEDEFPMQFALVWERATPNLYKSLALLSNVTTNIEDMSSQHKVEGKYGDISSTTPNTANIGDNVITTISSLNAQHASINQQQRVSKIINPLRIYHQINSIEFNQRISEWLDKFKFLFVTTVIASTTDKIKIDIWNQVNLLGQDIASTVINEIKNNEELSEKLKGDKGDPATDEQVRSVLVKWIMDRHELFSELVNDLNSEASHTLINQLTEVISSKIGDYVNTTNEKVQQLENNLQTVGSKAVTAENAVNQISPVFEQNQTDISTLKSGLSEFSAKVDQNDAEITALKKQQQTISDKANDSKNVADNAKEKADAAKDKIDRLEPLVSVGHDLINKIKPKVNLLLSDPLRIFNIKYLASKVFNPGYYDFDNTSEGYKIYTSPDNFTYIYGFYVYVYWDSNSNNKRYGKVFPILYCSSRICDSSSFWTSDGAEEGDLTVFVEHYLGSDGKTYYAEFSYKFTSYVDGNNLGLDNNLNIQIQVLYMDKNKLTLNGNNYPTSV